MRRYIRRAVGGLRGAVFDRLSAEHRRGLFSVGWTTFAQGVVLVFRFASALVLAALLTPGVYGLVGTALAVVLTLEWLADFGIRPALVRHPDGDRPEYLGTGWLLGLSRGALLSLMVAASAWPLAQFYGEEGLFGPLLLLAAKPLIHGLQCPTMPLLYRRLEYRTVFVLEVTQTLVGTATSIALAVPLRSPWALIGGILVGELAWVVLSYWVCPRPPRPAWDRSAARQIHHLGRQVLINTLAMALWQQTDRLLGLRLIGDKEAFGCYVIACNLAGFADGLAARCCDVHFSMLARREDAAERSAWHREVAGRVVAWLMPLMAAGVVAAPYVVQLLYRRDYWPAGGPLALLTAALMLRVLSMVQFQYLLVRAEVYRATWAYLTAFVCLAALVVPMSGRLGTTGLAGAVLISTAVFCLVQTLLMRRLVPAGPAWWVRTAGWVGVGLAVHFAVSG